MAAHDRNDNESRNAGRGSMSTIDDERLDLAMKRRELAIKKLEYLRSRSHLQRFGTVGITVAAAVISVAGTVASHYLQSKENRQLEREKAQNAILLEFSRTGDAARAKSNLQFLLAAGIFADQSRIENALKQREAPVLPVHDGPLRPLSSFPVDSIQRQHGNYLARIDIQEERGAVSHCTALELGDERAITWSGCVSSGSVTFRSAATEEVRTVSSSDIKASPELAVVILASPKIPKPFWPKFTASRPVFGQPVFLLQHSSGNEVRVGKENCVVTQVKKDRFGYNCDTDVGSGGASVFSVDGALLGIHTAKLSEVRAREAIAVEAIVKVFPELEERFAFR